MNKVGIAVETSGGLQSVQEELGQGGGSASVLREGQSQGRLQRCLLVDVVILKVKQGSSGELAQPGHAVPMESPFLWHTDPRNATRALWGVLCAHIPLLPGISHLAGGMEHAHTS